MSKEPTYSYDKEADVLYISFSPGEKATTAVELNDNILLRFNRAEKRAIGLTLMDFSVLVQLTNLGPRSFPLSGLSELEPDWQDTVIQIITSPPVNQILKVSVYTPSLAETVPITLVEKPPIPLAT
ncbi:MAG: DUF2283 domain-containing protein [Candidatus Tectomicrobia bacterium]|nr:DUF2283 domain-containing protein [Candidatus Tectomicrobia bacterium]